MSNEAAQPVTGTVCKHATSRLKFDGGNRSVICNGCNWIITRLAEETK